MMGYQDDSPSRAYSRFAPSQWETSLQSNAISDWLDTNLESALPQQWELGDVTTLIMANCIIASYNIVSSSGNHLFQIQHQAITKTIWWSGISESWQIPFENLDDFHWKFTGNHICCCKCGNQNRNFLLFSPQKIMLLIWSTYIAISYIPRANLTGPPQFLLTTRGAF